jgi:hypothetical protein
VPFGALPLSSDFSFSGLNVSSPISSKKEGSTGKQMVETSILVPYDKTFLMKIMFDIKIILF